MRLFGLFGKVINRRRHERLKLNAECNCYTKKRKELSATVDNISESGAGILFPKNYGTDLLSKGKIISLQTATKTEWNDKTHVIIAECKIVRRQSLDNGLFVGVKFLDTTVSSKLINDLKVDMRRAATA